MLKKFSIATLGCKINQYDSDQLAQEMEKAGLARAGDGERADVVVVNTCTVTAKASTQSRQAVRQAIKANKGALVVVSGCYAQTEPAALKGVKGVSFVVDNARRSQLMESILEGSPSKGALLLSGDVRECRSFPVPVQAVPGARSRPFLKVQDGCDAFCTYCIVPYTRGPSRSMPMEPALDHFRQLMDMGFSEIVLTGIHLGLYGQDISPKTTLEALVKEMLEAAEKGRVRLSSVEPNEVTSGLVDMMAANPRLRPHFHLPLQSGDDEILKRMNRPYDSGLFEELVRGIRSRLPQAAIGVDVLVGFPGEDAQAFANTLRLLERLPVSYFHVFPFSPRKGTPAARFSGQVEPGVMAKRTKALRDLGGLKRLAFYASNKGRVLEVCAEGRTDPATGLLKGVAENYVPVLFSAGNPPPKSALVQVEIQKVTPDIKVLGVMK